MTRLQVLPVMLFSMLACAEPVHVHYPQASSRGFVSLEDLAGKTLATGEESQVVRGSRITSRLTFHFLDGSLDDDTTVFTQQGTFHVLSDHHIQHGPSFPKPIDLTVDTASGTITSRVDKNGNPDLTTTHMDIPPDLANGISLTLIANLNPKTPETRLPYLTGGPKPRLVQLSVKPVGEQPFATGALHHTAMDFLVHIELGGIAGVVAPVIGKQPDDIHVWILAGAVPLVVKEEGQLYEGGPVWRIVLIGPTWPRRA